MRIFFMIILLLIFIMCVLNGINNFYNYRMLQKYSNRLGAESEFGKKEGTEHKKQCMNEKADEALANMLTELSCENETKDNSPLETYTFDELDAFDEVEHTETDPEKLLKLLEYGFPDEELEEIINRLESGK